MTLRIEVRLNLLNRLHIPRLPVGVMVLRNEANVISMLIPDSRRYIADKKATDGVPEVSSLIYHDSAGDESP